eukprot:757725-Hanusia_phi.AAC.4
MKRSRKECLHPAKLLRAAIQDGTGQFSSQVRMLLLSLVLSRSGKETPLRFDLVRRLIEEHHNRARGLRAW